MSDSRLKMIPALEQLEVYAKLLIKAYKFSLTLMWSIYFISDTSSLSVLYLTTKMTLKPSLFGTFSLGKRREDFIVKLRPSGQYSSEILAWKSSYAIIESGHTNAIPSQWISYQLFCHILYLVAINELYQPMHC